MCCRGERGFTLLEAVVALAVVALVSLAVLSTLGVELRTAARVRESLPAAALAEDRMGVLRLLSPVELASLPDSVGRGTFAPPFDAYGWTADARSVTGEPDLYDVEVEVRWTTGAFPLHGRVFRPAATVALPGARAP